MKTGLRTNRRKHDFGDARASAMPHNVRPMLARSAHKPFDDPNWFFEVKWDGYRAIAEVNRGQVRLYSRNLQPFEKRFAPVVESLRRLGHDAVLDGEVVVLDRNGKPVFDLLQSSGGARQGVLVYYVFDLLHLNGHDLTGEPLRHRKALLTEMLPTLPNIRLSEHIEGCGKDFFRVVREQALEGIVAKDSRSRYLCGRRSEGWLKIKAGFQQSAVIAGFRTVNGSRTRIGALVLGAYCDGALSYIGRVGSGFSDSTLTHLETRLAGLAQPTCPFSRRPKVEAGAYWVKPELVCEVRYTDWTLDGCLRHPVFLGLRSLDQSAARRAR